jgi:hypothetical protein
VNQPNSAATDIAAFVGDLDGGQFERQLSIALSNVAAAAVDFSKVGKVKIELSVQRIPGTHQVAIEHKLEFKLPTSAGHQAELATHTTVMHVGKYGALTLAQPQLTGMKEVQ